MKWSENKVTLLKVRVSKSKNFYSFPNLGNNFLFSSSVSKKIGQGGNFNILLGISASPGYPCCSSSLIWGIWNYLSKQKKWRSVTNGYTNGNKDARTDRLEGWNIDVDVHNQKVIERKWTLTTVLKQKSTSEIVLNFSTKILAV